MKYQQEQNPKRREAIYEKHTADIILFEAANCYITAHMNGKSGLPIKALTAGREWLYREYTRLKEETQRVEQIKRSVERILRAEVAAREPMRVQGIAL